MGRGAQCKSTGQGVDPGLGVVRLHKSLYGQEGVPQIMHLDFISGIFNFLQHPLVD